MKQMNGRPIDRIRELVDWLIVHNVVKSITHFERLCGLSNKYLNNLAATEKGNPGIDTVALIYDLFPALSLKWIITGNGNMFTVRNIEEMTEKMRIDVVSREVMMAQKEDGEIKSVLKCALSNEDLSAEDKIAILEKLI